MVIQFVHGRTSYAVWFLPLAPFQEQHENFMKFFCLSLSLRDIKLTPLPFPRLLRSSCNWKVR